MVDLQNSDICAQVAALVAATVGADAAQVSASSRLREDVGVDSLDLITLAVRIEEEFGVPTEQLELAQLTTVGDIAALITAQRAA